MTIKTPTELRVQLSLGLKAVLKKSTIKKLESRISARTGIKKLLETWADDYLRYLHTRHLLEGGPVAYWHDFKDRKKVLRDRQNKKTRFNTSESTKILIDTGQLLGTTSPGGRGQIRRIDTGKGEVRVGISGSAVYFDPRKKRLGRRSLGEIAQHHSNQKREIVVEPGPLTKSQMRLEGEKWAKELLSRTN